MTDARRSITRAAVAGFGFALTEAVAVWMNPSPMDPVPTWTVVAVSVIGTTALLAALATVLCTVSHKHAGVLALAAWAGIWGPNTAELAGWHRVGWAPSVVIAGMGPYAPVGVMALTVASGAAGPALRDGGSAQGIQAIGRAAPDRASQPDMLLVTVEGVGADDNLMDAGRWGRRNACLGPLVSASSVDLLLNHFINDFRQEFPFHPSFPHDPTGGFSFGFF